MPPSLSPSTITPSQFTHHLSLYPTLLPPALTSLEEARSTTIPATLQARRKAGDAFLTKAEVQELLQWKLKHGTFRPSLPKLVASNAAETVEEVTREGFRLHNEMTSTKSSESQTPLAALKKLAELRGIGPATASLLLSVYDTANVPFFGDELFRWICWDSSDGKGKGWERKIKYDYKEYALIWEGVRKLRARLGKEGKDVAALEVERAAWVLGREGVDVGVPVGKVRGKDEEEELEEAPPPKKRRRG